MCSECSFASEITITSIAPSKYYDSQPCIWGNYIVWRRAINQNEDEYIQLREPSWIMVYSLSSGKSWNITPENTAIKGDIYCHAQSPDIWNGKIIYEAQASANSYDTRLYMYNISSEETWQLPIKSTDYAHGHLHAIYDDWIVYTHIENNKRQTYLYNYEDGIYRTIVSKSESYSTYGLVMNNKNIILTVTNETGGFEMWDHNIEMATTTKITIINNYSQMFATSIYENNVGLVSIINNSVQTHIYNLETNETEVIENANSILLWGENIAYETNGTIHVGTDIEKYEISSSQIQHLGDIYGDTVVWIDNRDSSKVFGDARDNFDIYVRTILTDKEILNTNIIVAAVIITLIVIVLIVKSRNTSEI